jgi:hypothetical protein
MKQAKFIELLNLYVDGALSSAEAAELEREITADPARHKIYRQYCQMQKACTVLSERFRDVATPAATFRSGAVVGTGSAGRNGWLRPAAWVASGAVAACFAFIVVRSQLSPETPAVAVAPAPLPVMVVASTKGTLTPIAAPVVTVRPVLFRNPWSPGPAIPARMPGWQQLPLGERNQTLVVAPPNEFRDPNEPAGVAANPVDEPAALRMEDVEAAAFQFQR